MADTETTGKEPTKPERSPLEKWRVDCESAAHVMKLKSALLFHTFEKMDAEAFSELEYVESLWHHVNQLEDVVQELEQLMLQHVQPMREKAGLLEPRKQEAAHDA